MKFGLLTAILEGTTFEEAVDFAAENQLECLEVACWPNTGGEAVIYIETVLAQSPLIAAVEPCRRGRREKIAFLQVCQKAVRAFPLYMSLIYLHESVLIFSHSVTHSSTSTISGLRLRTCRYPHTL